MVLEHMEPLAASHPEGGLVNVLWSGGPEADLHPDDAWYEPEILELAELPEPPSDGGPDGGSS
jgi:hypothetical protein